MNTATELIAQFHEKFKLPNRTKPTWPGEAEREFRKTLIEEETQEAFDAMDGEASIQHVAKELADILYVVYGAACHYGIDLDAAFDAVHISNMTKLWLCEECEGTGTIKNEGKHKSNLRWYTMSCPVCGGDGLVARYREDGKVLKPPTYSPADLSFIEEPEHV